jgi:succinate dehydrogenase / fumarate reductase, iron-sulfur subunit
MKYTLLVWRQAGPDKEGKMDRMDVDGISPDMSFLEMLDFVNEKLIKEGKEPIEFDSDCREGICGSCGCVINGQAHGPQLGVATCQLYMRAFAEGTTIAIEPWRARAFPVIKDLVVDRSSMDRIIQAGGYTSAKSGKHADANAMLIPKEDADLAMEMAACIGWMCGGLSKRIGVTLYSSQNHADVGPATRQS